MTVLGVYWAPGHQRPTDIDYLRRLQPPAIRILDPGAEQLTIAHRAAPNALLLPRDWALSEQHDDVRRDPVGTGKRHAQDWRGKLDTWRNAGAQLPPDNQIVVVGINEPRVWDMLPQTVEYNIAFLDECTRLGLRACALNLSVGWPANNGPDTPSDWKPYAPIEAAIKRGNHFLTLHEYWYRTGPRDGWGWFAGRLQHCPWDVPIIIGECGIDMYVDMQRWEHDGKPNRGWRGNVDANSYSLQVEDYARTIDKRVVAILPFLTDYRSNNWESFDTFEAHGALLARKDRMVPQATFATRLPTVSTGPKPEPTPTPQTPMPTGIIEPRVAQAILKIESGGRSHGTDGRVIIRFESHIFKTYLRNDALWAEYFRADANRPWINQEWRRSPGDPWKPLHTGNQADEWAVFEFACRFAMGASYEAAHKSISMGAAQIMGFNHQRIGYQSATTMLQAFQDANMQTLGFLNFCLSDTGLFEAIKRKDWRTIARLYNGPGQIDHYAKLLEDAYKALGGGA